MHVLLLEIQVEIVSFDKTLGHDFINWSLNFRILQVFWVISSFRAQEMSFERLNVEFEVGGAIWKFQILQPRSSEGVLAWATTLKSCTSLERPKVRSSVNFELPEVCIIYRSLERRNVRSSDQSHFCMLARARKASLERGPKILKFCLSVPRHVLTSSLHLRHS